MDPKSVLCEYYKAGQCTKGFKCKYSHDLDIGRKTAKIDIFTDKCACWPAAAEAPSKQVCMLPSLASGTRSGHCCSCLSSGGG